MIDWARVQELQDEVGVEDFSEVVELFLEEVEEVIARLRDHPNSANLESDFHFLKGSALNLGFRALAEHSATGEKRAAAGGADGRDIDAVVKSYAASKAEFMARLDPGRAVA